MHIALYRKYRPKTFSQVIGQKYVSFTYLTDYNHNEVAIGFADTKTGATTVTINSTTGAAQQAILYYLSLS